MPLNTPTKLLTAKECRSATANAYRELYRKNPKTFLKASLDTKVNQAKNVVKKLHKECKNYL